MATNRPANVHNLTRHTTLFQQFKENLCSKQNRPFLLLLSKRIVFIQAESDKKKVRNRKQNRTERFLRRRAAAARIMHDPSAVRAAHPSQRAAFR